MKITVKELRDRFPSINKLLAFDRNVKLSYRMAKIARKVSVEMRDVEDARMKMVRKYGKEQSDGSMKVLETNNDAFEAEFNPILDEEIDLEITPIPVLLLKSLKLSPYDVGNLEGFIEEPSDADMKTLQDDLDGVDPKKPSAK